MKKLLKCEEREPTITNALSEEVTLYEGEEFKTVSFLYENINKGLKKQSLNNSPGTSNQEATTIFSEFSSPSPTRKNKDINSTLKLKGENMLKTEL
ncbi:MAG: hypothetical protein KIH01_03380 [Candidatus Freyarchaeota archaeon]|nr:hypothetical protein [Candidatus Jordarchaeia archaeon]